MLWSSRLDELLTVASSKDVSEFLVSDYVCAIAQTKNSREIVWFVLLIKQGTADQEQSDAYNHKIPQGAQYLEGRYLKEDGENKNDLKFRL